MSEQRKQILQMLAEGKINADEAERLLTALESETDVVVTTKQTETGGNGKPKFLHVKVNSTPGSHHKHENVDIKVPLVLLKAGMKLHSILPEGTKGKINEHLAEKGINFDINKIDGEHIDSIIQALTESSIDIDADGDKVKIYCA
jgi:hypothetical protein